MSNDTIFITQIASILGFIVTLFVLYRLLVSQKDSTIESLKTTVELLKEKSAWLDKQLTVSKESTPDILAERLSKRNEQLKSELEQLSKDYDGNANLIKQKEDEIRSVHTQMDQLRQQMEQAEALLEDKSAELEYVKTKVDECPYCKAPLSEMVNVELDKHTDGTVKSYACGFSELGGDIQHLCPSDPKYPKLEDFELVTHYSEQYRQWYCQPKPKTAMAQKLHLMPEAGSTEEEAKDRVVKRYNWWIDYHKKRMWY